MSVKALDHFVHSVEDIASARDALVRLGFQAGQIAMHREVGSSNAIIHFQNTYWEIFGNAHLIRGEKWRDLYTTRLKMGEGIANFSLTSSSLEKEQARLRAQGVAVEEVLNATRAVPLPDGRELLTDSHSFYTLLPGSPYASPFFSEHRNPAAIFVPEYQTHPNTAVDIVGFAMVTNDVADTAHFVSKLAQADAPELNGETARIALADGHFIHVSQPDALSPRYRENTSFDLSRGGVSHGMFIKVTSIDAAKAALASNQVPYDEEADRVLVNGKDGRGIFVEFSETFEGMSPQQTAGAAPQFA